jgi:hypothetical protein
MRGKSKKVKPLGTINEKKAVRGSKKVKPINNEVSSSQRVPSTMGKGTPQKAEGYNPKYDKKTKDTVTLGDYQRGHKKLVTASKAARKIQRGFRTRSARVQPVTQAMRDTKRMIDKEKKLYNTDASYKKNVLNKLYTTAGSAIGQGALSTAAKVGSGALVGYAAGNYNKTNEEDEEEQKTKSKK